MKNKYNPGDRAKIKGDLAAALEDDPLYSEQYAQWELDGAIVHEHYVDWYGTIPRDLYEGDLELENYNTYHSFGSDNFGDHERISRAHWEAVLRQDDIYQHTALAVLTDNQINVTDYEEI